MKWSAIALVGCSMALALPARADADAGASDAGADVDALRTRLDELSKRGTEEGIAAALSDARKANPTKYWSDDFDLLAALQSTHPSPTADDIVAIEIEAVFLKLQAVATTPAITAMIDHAGMHRSQFRFDVARRVRATGDRALPALILAKGGTVWENKKWASVQLEAMGKRVAGDAVQTKSDDVLVEVLTAFGTVHDRDALPVTLAFTSSERKPVREAARASVLSYDKDARPNLAEVYGNLVGHPVAADVPAAKIAVDLFALQDKQRLADLYAIVDLGLKEQASGDNAHAVEQFDRALAREPSLDRKKEMVPAFVARGDSLAETDPTAARRAYEEALALDPDTPRKGQIMGALALLDAEALEKRGIDDRASWERVLESDPGNAKANAAIERLNAAHADRSSRANEYEYGAAGALALICLLVLFGLRGKRA